MLPGFCSREHLVNRIYGLEEMLFKEQTMPVKFLTVADF